MKLSPVLAFLTLAVCGVRANDDKSENPIFKVVNLLRSLKNEIALDGKQEQQIFDKYACWVEEITKEVSADVEKFKVWIAGDQERIFKLKAEIATGTASIKNLADDIAENEAAQKEATEKRMADKEAFDAEMKDNVACRNALAEAIKVLKDTGTGAFLEKGNTLGAFQQTQVMSIAGGLRKALKHFEASTDFSEDDLNLVQGFVDRPADFFNRKTMSAAQVSETNNPFGDYSPQSTRIQGILKGMLQAFTEDIGKDAKAEEEAVADYTALTATRQRELATLETTKTTEEVTTSSNKKTLQETIEEKAQTEVDLEQDTAFLEETKKAGIEKSVQWNERSRLCTEELLGIGEAIDILTSGKVTFKDAFTSFMQTSSVQVVTAKLAQSRARSAFMQLQALATRYRSVQVAKIAASVQLGGHFDNVIAMIDQMMELLRKEEASDIFHKDRCESAENANKNEMEDLNTDLEKADSAIKKFQSSMQDTEATIAAMKADLADTTKEMLKQLKLRNEESAEFKKALKDDTDAIALIERAIVALSKYWTKNKLKLGDLLQESADPVYQIDRRTAPKADFSKADKKSNESGNIVAILEMIKEDLEKEVKTAREEEAADEADFEESKSKLQASVDSIQAGIAGLEGKFADTSSDMAAAKALETRKQNDLDGQGALKESLFDDCDWVNTNFQSRYDKRKTEMQGLTDAKAFLSGIMKGDTHDE